MPVVLNCIAKPIELKRARRPVTDEHRIRQLVGRLQSSGSTSTERDPTTFELSAHEHPSRVANLINSAYDAILFVGFGGPEGRDDVLPFLENVLRGKTRPSGADARSRRALLPLSTASARSTNRSATLIDAVLRPELELHRGLDLPIYWGNRNWHPMLEDTDPRRWPVTASSMRFGRGAVGL